MEKGWLISGKGMAPWWKRGGSLVEKGWLLGGKEVAHLWEKGGSLVEKRGLISGKVLALWLGIEGSVMAQLLAHWWERVAH